MDLPLDHYFSNTTDSWVAMRSSWSDNDAVYVAMKSSILTGHQTHGDLDAGDFVIDALGQRWAGEFGNGDYLSPDYFSNETQSSERWDYFRKSTAGQNTLSIGENQLVAGIPVNTFQTSHYDPLMLSLVCQSENRLHTISNRLGRGYRAKAVLLPLAGLGAEASWLISFTCSAYAEPLRAFSTVKLSFPDFNN